MSRPQWSLTFEVRKSVYVSSSEPFIMAPQWSLTFEVRKSDTLVRRDPRLCPAAMEPDL